MNRFKYIKGSGEVSERVVFPTGLLDFGTEKVKLQAIDLSDMTAEEREEAEIILTAIRRQYLDSMVAAGFGSRYRSFFLSGISE